MRGAAQLRYARIRPARRSYVTRSRAGCETGPAPGKEISQKPDRPRCSDGRGRLLADPPAVRGSFKHTTPCGIAVAGSAAEDFRKARATTGPRVRGRSSHQYGVDEATARAWTISRRSGRRPAFTSGRLRSSEKKTLRVASSRYRAQRRAGLQRVRGGSWCRYASPSTIRAGGGGDGRKPTELEWTIALSGAQWVDQVERSLLAAANGDRHRRGR